MTSPLGTALRDLADSADVGRLPRPAELRANGERRRRRTRVQVAVTAGVVAAVSVAVIVSQDPTVPNPQPAQPPSSPTTSDAHPQQLATDGHRLSPRAIAASAGTYVVVGDSSDLSDDPGPPVYWSDDGSSWGAAGAPPNSVNVTDVIATPDGFIAVGVGRDGPAAWRSPDGDIWVEVPVRTTGKRATGGLWGITSTSLGLYAWGRDGDDGWLWRSVNGTSWTPVSSSSGFDRPSNDAICTVRDVDDGLRATGLAIPRGSLQGPTVVWTSTDGDTWTRTEDAGRTQRLCDPPTELGHLEARGDAGVVLVSDPFGEGDRMELVPDDN